LLQHLLYLSSLAHPDTSEIDIQDLTPILGHNFRRWYGWATDTGIVNSDVYTSKGAYRLAYAVFDRFLAADVHFDRLDVDIGVSPFQLIHRCLQSLWIDINNCQLLDAMGREAVCGVLANP
jgi:hypothetical protein